MGGITSVLMLHGELSEALLRRSRRVGGVGFVIIVVVVVVVVVVVDSRPTDYDYDYDYDYDTSPTAPRGGTPLTTAEQQPRAGLTRHE